MISVEVVAHKKERRWKLEAQNLRRWGPGRTCDGTSPPQRRGGVWAFWWPTYLMFTMVGCFNLLKSRKSGSQESGMCEQCSNCIVFDCHSLAFLHVWSENHVLLSSKHDMEFHQCFATSSSCKEYQSRALAVTCLSKPIGAIGWNVTRAVMPGLGESVGDRSCLHSLCENPTWRNFLCDRHAITDLECFIIPK